MKIILTYTVMVSLTVIANLLLKTGASTGGVEGSYLLSYLNWRTILGLASFGMAGLIYVIILKWLPLNVAQSFATVQFIAVIIASWLILGEPMTALRWVGIIVISIGILIVSQSLPSA